MNYNKNKIFTSHLILFMLSTIFEINNLQIMYFFEIQKSKYSITLVSYLLNLTSKSS